jgi:hypothetical protein
MEGGAVGHNFERDPPRDHPCQVRFNLVQRFQRRRFKCESIRRTTDAKWWQKVTWPLTRWAKNVGYVAFISRRTSYTFTFKSPPLKPLNQIKPNLAGMVPWWIPFKIVSDSSAKIGIPRIIMNFRFTTASDWSFDICKIS